MDASVAVNILSDPYATGGTGYGGSGGGFIANFSVDFPAPVGAQNFSEYLIWCIDAGRGVNLPSTVNYQLYTLADFAAPGTRGSVTGHNPDLGDMSRIASLQSALFGGWSGNAATRNDMQGAIWSWFDGYTTYGGSNAQPAILAGDPYFNVSEYYVLWNGENQTFLTKIPEPSSTLLAFAGLGALLIVSRRRRIS